MHAKTVVAIGIFLLVLVIVVGVLLRRVLPSQHVAVQTSEEIQTVSDTAGADNDPSFCQRIKDPAEQATCIAKASPPPEAARFFYQSKPQLEALALREAVDQRDPSLCQTIQNVQLLAQCVQRAGT